MTLWTPTHRGEAGSFTPTESDRLFRLVETYSLAARVPESAEAGDEWLAGPAVALGNRTPLEHLRNEAGWDAVQETDASTAIGDEWYDTLASVALRVPSVGILSGFRKFPTTRSAANQEVSPPPCAQAAALKGIIPDKPFQLLYRSRNT